MWYTCSKCKESYKGNDGGLFNQISSHYRRAYPVAPRYAVGYDVHLTEPTTHVLENLMLTYGNGDMLSRLLHELQAMAYEDTEENYYDNVNDLEIKISKQLPKFSDYGPRVSGQSIRDRHNYAATSELTSTGISDVMRQTREIQSVGCCISSASDHTFQARKNYRATDIDKAEALHTINVETGEITSAVLVQTTEATQFSH